MFESVKSPWKFNEVWGVKMLFFLFHVSEHIHHFKVIKKITKKKTEIVWFWGTPPPPQFGKNPNFFHFFHLKASLIAFLVLEIAMKTSGG